MVHMWWYPMMYYRIKWFLVRWYLILFDTFLVFFFPGYNHQKNVNCEILTNYTIGKNLMKFGMDVLPCALSWRDFFIFTINPLEAEIYHQLKITIFSSNFKCLSFKIVSVKNKDYAWIYFVAKFSKKSNGVNSFSPQRFIVKLQALSCWKVTVQKT